MDRDTGERTVLNDANLTVTGNHISFLSQGLIFNRRYDTSIEATNIAGSATSHRRISEAIVILLPTGANA